MSGPLRSFQRSTPEDVRAVSAAMGLCRLAIGAALGLAPRTALAALGFREVSEEAVVVTRIAGGRDFVMGAATLLALDDPARLRVANLANAAADAGDSATFAAAIAAGEGTRVAGLRGICAALPATLVGLWAERRLS